jgi:prophage maintenance system killer protein
MLELLEYQHFIDINEELYRISLEYGDIEYSGKEDYPIIKRKIRALVYNVPEGSFLYVATYYLRNLILLQPFADGNHRTALHSVKLFSYKNGREFNYTDIEAHEFQISLYKARGTYEAMDVHFLLDSEDDTHLICKKFIEDHLTQNDQ